MSNIDISSEWKAVAEAIHEEPGIVLVLGLPDSGKSTLSRYLVDCLTHVGRLVAMIDCDVGQTQLGPPTTMGMLLYSQPTHQFDTLNPDHMRFIGATSPAGHLLEVVVGTKKLADKALDLGAEAVIVNTSGLILGAAGAELKLNKIDLLCPQYVLALQDSSEIEHLLTHLEKRRTLSVFRLPISEFVKKRTPEVRRRFREKRYRDYFKKAQVVKRPPSQIDPQGYIWCREKKVRTDALENLLVGLCDPEDYLLALGILQKLDMEEGVLHIVTPLNDNDVQNVTTVRLGGIKIDADGREAYVGEGLFVC